MAKQCCAPAFVEHVSLERGGPSQVMRGGLKLVRDALKREVSGVFFAVASAVSTGHCRADGLVAAVARR